MQLEIDGNRELTAEFRHNCIDPYTRRLILIPKSSANDYEMFEISELIYSRSKLLRENLFIKSTAKISTERT